MMLSRSHLRKNGEYRAERQGRIFGATNQIFRSGIEVPPTAKSTRRRSTKKIEPCISPLTHLRHRLYAVYLHIDNFI
jgi:hypothetical protein